MFSTLSNVLAVVPAAQWWGGWGRPGATGFNEFLNLGLNFSRFTWFLASDLFSRFACFPCNFDLCESCITRKLGRSLLNPDPSRSSLLNPDPSPPSRSHVNPDPCSPSRTPAREASSPRPSRDSWCFGQASNFGARAPTGYQQETIGPMDPSAPLLPQHEEPPPSYQEAIRERV